MVLCKNVVWSVLALCLMVILPLYLAKCQTLFRHMLPPLPHHTTTPCAATITTPQATTVATPHTATASPNPMSPQSLHLALLTLSSLPRCHQCFTTLTPEEVICLQHRCSTMLLSTGQWTAGHGCSTLQHCSLVCMTNGLQPARNCTYAAARLVHSTPVRSIQHHSIDWPSHL